MFGGCVLFFVCLSPTHFARYRLTQFTQIYQAIKVLTIHAAPAHYFPMLLSHAATDKGGERQLELREEVRKDEQQRDVAHDMYA